MSSRQVNAWLLSGDGMKLWDELYAQFNLKPFVGGNTGMQMGGWFNREINSLEDLKGLKMRMPGLGGKVLEAVGATAILSPGSEIYTNLERGVIDATEWIGPFHDYIMGFHKIAQYYYYPGWHEPGSVLEFMMNKRIFDELSVDLKSIIQTAAEKINHWVFSEIQFQNAQHLQLIKDESSVELRRFAPEILGSFKTATKDVIHQLIDRDPFSKKVYASYNKYMSISSEWGGLSHDQLLPFSLD